MDEPGRGHRRVRAADVRARGTGGGQLFAEFGGLAGGYRRGLSDPSADSSSGRLVRCIAAGKPGTGHPRRRFRDSWRLGRAGGRLPAARAFGGFAAGCSAGPVAGQARARAFAGVAGALVPAPFLARQRRYRVKFTNPDYRRVSMRAIILAAGRGLRLQQADDRQMPKCLLQFGGMSLLERHLRMLKNAGVEEVVLALGYRHERVEAELDRLRWQPRPEIVLNPRFELGRVLTVPTVAEALTRGGGVLLMDADV